MPLLALWVFLACSRVTFILHLSWTRKCEIQYLTLGGGETVYEQSADYSSWGQDTASTGATVKIQLTALDDVFVLYIIITGLISKEEGRN
jgi:hypothetical protein